MADSDDVTDPAYEAAFDEKLAEIRRRDRHEAERRRAMRRMWLSHHWPEDYQQRCVTVAGRPVCRRCLALYPLGVVTAVLAAAGAAPWPASIDPWPIWLLSLPATIAYVGEAIGWFRYDARVQVATTLAAAVAFGRALGYELVERWSPEFWGPIAVFGGIWFTATVIGHRSADRKNGDQRAATASTSSSSVL